MKGYTIIVSEELKDKANDGQTDNWKFLILIIVLISTILPSYLTYVPELGEIWNYQYARRILYGQIPYKDFGMLQLPFSAQVNAVFLYLFPTS